jgi:undecaprenyl-diphosphatase
MKIPLYSLAVIIAFSRVYVGVHYPADVLLGGLIGYGMAWVILTLWVILKMRELKRGQTWVWYEGDLQNK